MEEETLFAEAETSHFHSIKALLSSFVPVCA